MQIKRPANLFLRKLRRPEFDLADLVSGGPGVVVREQWQALAPHLGKEVDLEFEDLAVLDAERESLAARDRLAQATTAGATSLVAVYKALGGRMGGVLHALALTTSVPQN